MADFIKKMLKGYAVYWPPGAIDATGQPSWGPAVEIRVRWEKRQAQFISPDGERRFSSAVVYTLSDVAVQGVLCCDRLVNVDTSDPKANTDAWEILQFNKDPHLKKRNVFLRTAFL